jgi:hypothetical protein
VLHVEATDEVATKARRREGRRARAMGCRCDGPSPTRSRAELLDPVAPDHARPASIKTHTADRPYLFDSATSGGRRYTEPATASSPPVAAHTLMGRLLAPV